MDYAVEHRRADLSITGLRQEFGRLTRKRAQLERQVGCPRLPSYERYRLGNELVFVRQQLRDLDVLIEHTTAQTPDEAAFQRKRARAANGAAA